MTKNLFLAYVISLFVVCSLPASTALAGILPQDGDAQYELEFWQSIQDSTDAEDYEAYLEAYPNGKFAPLARSRAARYRKAQPVTPQAAAAVTDMDIYYNVVTDANFRREPTSQSEKLGILQRGSRVHVTGRVVGKSWYRIQTDDNLTAYVFAELLREPPILQTPPAPVQTPVQTPVQAPVQAPAPAPAAAGVSAAAGRFETVRDCSDCPEMIVLPPGSFLMGDTNGDRSEKPAHKVTIKSAFAIGKYEVTTAEWNECVKAGGCSHKLKDDPAARSPVRDVSWADAQEYTHWLSKITGKHYRLPTEAEWEYAARAGTQTRYWWGQHADAEKANCKACGGTWDHDKPVEVDHFPPNPFGLYATSGSVWEWVADCWHHNYEGAPTDGSSWDSPDCREYVIRGGSWRNDSTYVHSASRFTYDANVRYLLNGFRVAKSLP
jgi:formylglycine-generating enzyme required for sulfatase activity